MGIVNANPSSREAKKRGRLERDMRAVALDVLRRALRDGALTLEQLEAAAGQGNTLARELLLEMEARP